MPGPAAPIAVITVTWNSETVVAGLLESVRGSRFNGDYRMIVVDNDSADATLEVVARTMPEARVVSTGRNAGYAAGANAGIAAGSGCRAFLLLNPDLRLHTDTLQLLVDELDRSGAGIVVPRLVDATGSLRWSIRRDPTALRAWGEALLGGARAGRFPALGEVERREYAYEAPGDVDWSTGAAMLISRDCAEQVGTWDESYFLYSEETDFALRARDHGFAIRYVPEAKAIHFEGESHQSPSLFALLTLNRVKLYRSRHGRLRTAVFWLGVFLGELLRSRDPVHRAAAAALLGRRSGVARPSD